jgi:hypothetical protein
MTDGPVSLAAALDAAASILEAVDRRQDGDVTTWSIAGIDFATVERAAPDRAEFRLSPAIVVAARRTPDTGPSRRGTDWVAFVPREIDRHALDRATAWLDSAWRRADGET